MNPHIDKMCELQVTVKLYKATCNMSGADSYFFQNQKYTSSCSLLNDCITNRDQIARGVWISNEKRNNRFTQNCS